jgi:uncharacterized protein YbjT (DUF2867 family)
MTVFITGGTGYMGARLIPTLLSRGHQVTALAREQSVRKLPPACKQIIGNALDGNTYQSHVGGADVFVHLVGVAHPSPSKAAQFRQVDRCAALEAIRVANEAKIGHFVYLSVAQPAPMMRDYIAVRAECERAIAATELKATILRPWYVLGPGHRWPYVLLPFYRIAETLPRTRESAARLGLVTIDQMIAALVNAVENPPQFVSIVDVPGIRKSRSA